MPYYREISYWNVFPYVRHSNVLRQWKSRVASSYSLLHNTCAHITSGEVLRDIFLATTLVHTSVFLTTECQLTNATSVDALSGISTLYVSILHQWISIHPSSLDHLHGILRLDASFPISHEWTRSMALSFGQKWPNVEVADIRWSKNFHKSVSKHDNTCHIIQEVSLILNTLPFWTS